MGEITYDDLSQDQKTAYDAIVNGQNAILLGEGGSGKSTVANLAIDELIRRKLNVMVCAPTAIAALNLGGTTCHRVFGLHLYPETSASIHKADQIPFELWCADVIIIDEISMMACDKFDWAMRKVSFINAKRAQKVNLTYPLKNGLKMEIDTNKPPIQVVLIGDFAQLPPVVTKKHGEILRKFYKQQDMSPSDAYFAFEGMMWEKFGFITYFLKQNMRVTESSTSEAMTANLNLARVGDPRSLEFFNRQVSRDLEHDTRIRLFARNTSCDKYNDARLDELNERKYIFPTIEEGDITPADRIIKYGDLKLKVGARVMALANIEDIANGSLGYVTNIHQGHTPETDNVTINFDDIGTRVLSRKDFDIFKYSAKETKNGYKVTPEIVGKQNQIPIRLTWGITVHKSQGQTFEEMTCDFSDAWNAPGLIYVGLSRARSIEGISLVSPISPWTLACSPMVANFYRQIDPTFDYVHGLDIETNIDEYARAVRAGIPPIDVKAYVDAWANQARVFGKWIDQPAEK